MNVVPVVDLIYMYYYNVFVVVHNDFVDNIVAAVEVFDIVFVIDLVDYIVVEDEIQKYLYMVLVLLVFDIAVDVDKDYYGFVDNIVVERFDIALAVDIGNYIAVMMQYMKCYLHFVDIVDNIVVVMFVVDIGCKIVVVKDSIQKHLDLM